MKFSPKKYIVNFFLKPLLWIVGGAVAISLLLWWFIPPVYNFSEPTAFHGNQWYNPYTAIDTNDLKLSKLVDELDRENKFQTEISNEILDGVLEEINLFNKSIVEQDEDYLPKNLIVFDDCVHLLPKAYTKNSSFNKLITAQRHFKTCVIIMSQKYKMLNSLIRNNQDLITIFPVFNEFEKKSIIDDINVHEKIWDFAMSGEDDHPFLHVSYCAGKPLYFRKFDRIETEGE